MAALCLAVVLPLVDPCIFVQTAHVVPVWYYLSLSWCPRKAGFLPSFPEERMSILESIGGQEGGTGSCAKP